MGSRPKTHATGHRQRMRHRVMEHGTGHLADYELLEILLFYAVPRRDTKPLAKDLLDHFGSLTALLQASREQLEEMGLTQRVIDVLHIPFLAAHALVLEKPQPLSICLSNMKALQTYLARYYPLPPQQETHILYLDGRNRLLKDECVPEHLSLSNKHKHIALQALDHHATALLVVHLMPAHAAVVLAQEARGLALALQPLSILLHDAMLCGNGWMSSLKREGLL